MQDERERRIKARAFELWQQEGSLDGRALSHWTQAELEIDREADESGVESDEGVIVAGEDARRRLSNREKPKERQDPDYPKEPTDHAKLVAGKDAHETPGYHSQDDGDKR